MAYQKTLLDCIRRLFPDGTQIFLSAKIHDKWPPCPNYSVDMFAAMGHLLEQSGAYQYFHPAKSIREMECPPDVFGLTDTDRKAINNLAKEWIGRTNYRPPSGVLDLWDVLGEAMEQPVFHDTTLPDPIPEWWKTAFTLFLIADKTYELLRTQSPVAEDNRASFLQDALYAVSVVRQATSSLPQDSTAAPENDEEEVKNQVPFRPSLTLNVDPDIVCVQPKARTPGLGCTLRTLSNHLALLPGRGVIHSHWKAHQELRDDEDSSLNLLLIPYPFKLPAKWFKAHQPSTDDQESAPSTHWGWFELEQGWLHEQPPEADETDDPTEAPTKTEALKNFVSALIQEAEKDLSHIHGVIFPEYALDWPTFKALYKFLQKTHPAIQFLIAGSSSDNRLEKGNYVLTTDFDPTPRQGTPPKHITTCRAKHHRWRITGEQAKAYGLASELDPRKVWWEKVTIPRREIHVHQFRKHSTLVSMICEDLARMDPCHSVLRAIAPSLVVVLLMDGPQIPERWSSRYATTLADDPGSSVLTLTSLGLIRRGNATRTNNACHSIALWKEDTGRTVPIQCEPGEHGVVITLSGFDSQDASMAGYLNKNSRAWRYNASRPLTISRDSRIVTNEELDLVTGRDD